MKKLLFLLLTITLFSCKEKPVELNVMTYNIRFDNPQDSLNSWQYRKDVAAQIIKDKNIDIVGTQEVLVNQLNDLKERLPEYAALGVGRLDGKEAGEYSPLLYKKNRFTEIESGHFWLSENPEAVGVKGWDAACERVATWAILKDKESGKEFFVLNTHLDHMGQIARQESVKLLLKKSSELSKGLPVIITGDFNAESDSDVIKHLTESKQLIDSKSIAASTKGAPYTFHNFGRIPAEERPLIDYIFVNDKSEVLEYEVISDKLNDIYLSDHAPVSVKLNIK